MKNRMLLAVAGILLAAAFPLSAFATEGKVLNLQVRPGKDRTTIEISHSGAAKFRMMQSERRGSVIVEAENIFLPPQLTKLIDASSSGGPVLQLTPYNSTVGKKSLMKLVIQLRGSAEAFSTELPGKYVVEISRKAGAAEAKSQKPREIWSEVEGLVSRAAANQKSEEIARKLIEVLNTPQDEKKYFGSKVTFEAKEAEVLDIFRLVGESSDLNIVADPDIDSSKKTSLAVKDLPWDHLLDIVVQQHQFKAMVMGNVVRIMTIKTFTDQAEARKKELSLSDELEPVVMAVIPLSFAKPKDMKTMIDALIQKKEEKGATATGPGGGGPSNSNQQTGQTGNSSSSSSSSTTKEEPKLNQDFQRGRIEEDARTASLVVTNTKDAIERIRRLIRELDVPVPQVLIDAKIIIASENFSRQVGIKWQEHITSESGAAGHAGAFGAGSTEVLGGGSDARDGNSQFEIAGGENAAGLGFGFGAGNKANLTAQLNLAEINGISKTVASPRIIVNDKMPAHIEDGVTISRLAAGENGGSAIKDDKQAKLTLDVTPSVTSQGSVQLTDLKVNKSAPISNSAGTLSLDEKSLTTDVVVDSGATLVLGGIYQLSQTDGEGGIPILKDLPFIGQLFRVNSQSFNKSELMVFITPQIIDPVSTGQEL